MPVWSSAALWTKRDAPSEVDLDGGAQVRLSLSLDEGDQSMVSLGSRVPAPLLRCLVSSAPQLVPGGASIALGDSLLWTAFSFARHVVKHYARRNEGGVAG